MAAFVAAYPMLCAYYYGPAFAQHPRAAERAVRRGVYTFIRDALADGEIRETDYNWDMSVAQLFRSVGRLGWAIGPFQAEFAQLTNTPAFTNIRMAIMLGTPYDVGILNRPEVPDRGLDDDHVDGAPWRRVEYVHRRARQAEPSDDEFDLDVEENAWYDPSVERRSERARRLERAELAWDALADW